jgi:hypothetical protein
LKPGSSNLVFPDTVQNEGRMWRNVSQRPFTTATKIGLALLALLGWGFFIRMLFAMVKEGVIWPFVLGMILLWGPIFGVIAWATRRALRNIHNTKRNHRG